MSGALGAIVTQLNGGAIPLLPPRTPERQMQAAEDLQWLSALAKETGNPKGLRSAAALDAFLAGAGALEQLLGFATKRGGSRDKPHRQVLKEKKRQALQALGASGGTTPGAQAREALRKIMARGPEVRALHETHGVRAEELPQSADHIARILRQSP